MGHRLVTGGIGAGKTCFVVATIIEGEQGAKVDYEDAVGQSHTATRRILVAGIRGLTLEHERLPHPLTGEKIDPKAVDRWNRERDGNLVLERRPGDPPLTHELLDDGRVIPLEHTLQNWWLWCLPGDLIVCDEVQYMIPRGTLGRAPPHYIKALEVSRHYGVDFVFISQHPQLLDTTIRALVTDHRHIRHGIGPACIVYSWDHASNVDRITLAAKSKFIRRRRHFELYKSTVAITKQPSKVGWTLYAIPLCLAFAGWRIYAQLHGHRAEDALPIAAAVAAPVPARAASSSSRERYLAKFPMMVDQPRVEGCYTVGDKCKCQSEGGLPVRVTDQLCRASLVGYDGLVDWQPRPKVDGTGYGAAGAPGVSASAPAPSRQGLFASS